MMLHAFFLYTFREREKTTYNREKKRRETKETDEECEIEDWRVFRFLCGKVQFILHKNAASESDGCEWIPNGICLQTRGSNAANNNNNGEISTHVNIFLQTTVTKQTKQRVRKNNRSRTSNETKIYQTTIDERVHQKKTYGPIRR